MQILLTFFFSDATDLELRRRCQENDLGQISKDRAKYVRHDAMPTGLCKSEFIKN